MSSSFSIAALFATPRRTLLLALALRVGLVLYGAVQDAVSPVKYTDIDYFVFTAAAAHVAQGGSPYARATYRYTPLLAWALAPTARGGPLWFAFGKALFAAADLVAGWLVYLVLHRYYDGSCNGSSGRGMASERALRFASLWLLNPMVAQISTRGSSEGLLAVMVVALLWAVLARHVRLAGVLLGLAVHWKIYPVVYAVSIIWWLDDDHRGRQQGSEGQDNGTTKKENEKEADRMKTSGAEQILYFLNPDRATFAVYSFVTFLALNYAMYRLYGMPFLEHSYLHHLTRLDHRHNFSPYNVLLYLSSAHVATPSSAPGQTLKLEALAFVPQLVLCAVLIPLVLAKRDLAATMLAQTFAFVTFNKVCTSQYFLWYLIFLPFYLPWSTFLRSPIIGFAALTLWICGQALWLFQAYRLEFLGRSTFIPGLWLSSLFFFAVNAWILGVILRDIRAKSPSCAVHSRLKRPEEAKKAQ